jgi:hypothetical protein
MVLPAIRGSVEIEIHRQYLLLRVEGMRILDREGLITGGSL